MTPSRREGVQYCTDVRQQLPVSVTDSLCDSLKSIQYSSTERNPIPNPFCERSRAPDVRYEAPPLRASPRHQLRCRAKEVCVRTIVRLGKSRGVISPDGSTTAQRNAIFDDICCDPKMCIFLAFAFKNMAVQPSPQCLRVIIA